ncbi:MAG: amino acid permease [Methanomicrobium sp.]|nr:amino acid permease [Methanomicrobium sp.]
MKPEKVPALLRTLTLPEVTLTGIGVILGAGIYALIGEAAALSGNALWLSFVFSSMIALFTGLSYMELSSMFPLAGAEYEYTKNSFGSLFAFVIGMLVILSSILGSATVALGFAGYLYGLFKIPVLFAAVLLLVSLSLVIYTGIRQSAKVAIICTLIEAGGLIGIIVIGLPYIGSVDYLAMPLGLSGIFQAAALLFFAYQGFEEIVKLSEETVEPEKNIPKGLILAVIITVILYIAVAISIVSIGGWEEIAGSPNPFAKIAGVAFPEGYTLFSAIALFATANTVLLMLLSGSRIIYGIAKKGKLPKCLAVIHQKRKTPTAAIAVSCIASIIFLGLGNINDIAYLTNFTLFVTFAVINASVISLRFQIPDYRRPFKIKGSFLNIPVIPAAGLITCLFFLFQLNSDIFTAGIAIVAVLFIAGFILNKKTQV